MKKQLWFIFSLALILGLLLSVNLTESVASLKSVGIMEGDLAGIIGRPLPEERQDNLTRSSALSLEL
jgi:LytS/YehU family sensor histidine kinase